MYNRNNFALTLFIIMNDDIIKPPKTNIRRGLIRYNKVIPVRSIV